MNCVCLLPLYLCFIAVPIAKTLDFLFVQIVLYLLARKILINADIVQGWLSSIPQTTQALTSNRKIA